MPTITLPDGTTRHFEQPVTVAEVASDIGAGLAKATLAGKVNNTLVDTSFLIEADADIQMITGKDPEGLEIIRHSTAHLLAQAVKEIFPSAQVTIGPVIENGFYYDFAFERSFTEDDLARIEKKMSELAKQNFTVTREVMPRDEALTFFRNMGEEYKAQIIEDIPQDETLTLYKQGDFVDLCRGPHVPNTSHLGSFKLMKLAGAYWRGDSNNEMLQRVYGTAWQDKKALKAYLHRLEEAEKRDHRKIAKQLNLFHMQEEAPGMVFWHRKGWTLYQIIENKMRDFLNQSGYREIRTPQILDRSLWEKSGHMAKFSDDIFMTETESREYAIKPMSCPCHVQVFKQGLHSYRELPLRLAEFGNVHRNEPSGTLHGLMRLRNFTQDDGHIFCTPQQIQEEVSAFIDQVFEVYKQFGFHDVLMRLSTRPEKRVGADEVWDVAENALEVALNNKDIDWELLPGEGAFYGPKIEFSLKDCIGRVWQCGTIQVDFSMPDRLGAQYIDEHGERQVPVMLHRAIFGSLERFIGVLIEHYAGRLPVWLSPVQVVVMNISEHQAEFAQEVTDILQKRGIRLRADLRNEKIGFKIREHTLQKVPFQLIIGDREVEHREVSVRTCRGEDLGSMDLDAFVARFETSVANPNEEI